LSKEKGYIRLYRSLYDNFLWKDKEVFDRRSAWIDLLFMANWQPTERLVNGVLIKLKRGELFASVRFLATRWGWSINKVRRFLTLLETQGMVTQKRNTKGTVIRIEKYDYFQGSEHTDEYSDEYTDDTPVNTVANTNIKNLKESNTLKKNIRGGGRIVEE